MLGSSRVVCQVLLGISKPSVQSWWPPNPQGISRDGMEGTATRGGGPGTSRVALWLWVDEASDSGMSDFEWGGIANYEGVGSCAHPSSDAIHML